MKNYSQKVKRFYEKKIPLNTFWFQANHFGLNLRKNIEIESNIILQNNPQNILEVGSGYGRLVKAFQHIHYTSIEIVEDYVKKCQKDFKKEKFILGDFFNYNFKEKFDAVLFSWTVLGHYDFNNQKKALIKSLDLLSDNGKIYVNYRKFEDFKKNYSSKSDFIEEKGEGWVIKTKVIDSEENIGYFISKESFFRQLSKDLNLEIEFVEKKMIDSNYTLNYVIFNKK